MKVNIVLLIAFLLLSVYSAKFNIASTSTCTSTSAAGFCTKWEQNGTVEEQTASCFPGAMLVLTSEGFKTFQQLQIGDQILSYDRTDGEIYTKVRGWFHKDPISHVEYMKMSFQNGQNLLVSQKHNIAFKQENNHFRFMFADSIEKQTELFSSKSSIQSVSMTSLKGMYAPMTYNNNYFVFTSTSDNKVKILAHDFANLKNPQTYQPLGNMIFSAYQYFNGQQTEEGIHPAASWLMKKFDFLLQ